MRMYSETSRLVDHVHTCGRWAMKWSLY